MKSLENNQYRYENGIRLIKRDDNNYTSEDDAEFIERMKDASDISWSDLDRSEQLLPVFDMCKKDRRDFRSALEGIACGGKMLEVTSKAGFLTWGEFETHALRKCKASRELYKIAKLERANRRLYAAEEALHERAVDGVDEPMVNHLGQIVGYKKKYSDRLLEVQLKALDPDKYKDNNKRDDKGLVINVDMNLRNPIEKEIKPVVEFTGLQVIEDQEDKEESSQDNS
jgi:hypothetical protein